MGTILVFLFFIKFKRKFMFGAFTKLIMTHPTGHRFSDVIIVFLLMIFKLVLISLFI